MNSGEEIFPAADAGTLARNLSITSPALYQQAITAPRFIILKCKTLKYGETTTPKDYHIYFFVGFVVCFFLQTKNVVSMTNTVAFTYTTLQVTFVTHASAGKSRV